MATTFASSTAQIAVFFSSLRSRPSLSHRSHSSLHPTSPLTTISSRNPIFSNHPFHLISQRRSKIRAVTQDVTSEVTAIETSQDIVATGDDGVSTVISVLLFVAFVGLSIVTIGVIYLGVTDFLQKREKDKFEKEEAAKQSGKKKKKKKARARAGPRGFGQKFDEDEDDD